MLARECKTRESPSHGSALVRATRMKNSITPLKLSNLFHIEIFREAGCNGVLPSRANKLNWLSAGGVPQTFGFGRCGSSKTPNYLNQTMLYSLLFFKPFPKSIYYFQTRPYPGRARFRQLFSKVTSHVN